MPHPSKANEQAFARAVDDVAAVATRLIQSLVSGVPPRNRDEEIRKARERSRVRFGKRPTSTRAEAGS